MEFILAIVIQLVLVNFIQIKLFCFCLEIDENDKRSTKKIEANLWGCWLNCDGLNLGEARF